MILPSDPPSGGDLPNLDLVLPERGTGVRAARRAAAPPSAAPTTGPSRRWMTGFVSAVVALAVVAGALAFVGVQTLRDSTAGRRVTSAGPTDPGFEGLLASTPTLLVIHAHEGVLKTAAVLALQSGDAGGSILLLPPAVEVGEGEDAATLAVTFAFAESPEIVRGAAEAVTGVGVDEVVVIDDDRWTTLVAPTAPLVVDNPSRVGSFRSGEIEVDAEEIARWLRASGRGETELEALYRQQLFWEAWTAAIASSDDPAAVPGELDVGLGRFVRGLAAGPVRVEMLPVLDLTDKPTRPLFQVDRAALRGFITDLVPFPTGTALAPRTRVRLLDGAGQADHVERIAATVVASDSTVVVVGNADAFDYTTTEIRYHQPGQRRAAQRLRTALGAGRVIDDVRPIDAFDVTIVLGTDT